MIDSLQADTDDEPITRNSRNIYELERESEIFIFQSERVIIPVMIVMNQSHSSSFLRLPANQRFLPFPNLDDNFFRLRGYELS